MLQQTSGVTMKVPEDRDGAVCRYREGSALLEHVVMGLEDADLDAKPSRGGWSIRQIVHHIADGDDIWKLGIKMALGCENAEFALGWYSSQTQDAWADRWAYSRRSIGESISLFKATREHVLQLLASVPDAWNRAVIIRSPQGEFETVPVGFVIQMQADHALHHIERIRAILRERQQRCPVVP